MKNICLSVFGEVTDYLFSVSSTRLPYAELEVYLHLDPTYLCGHVFMVCIETGCNLWLCESVFDERWAVIHSTLHL